MSMEDVTRGMDEGRASVQSVMENAAHASRELRDATAEIQAMEGHLRAALATAERIALLVGFSVVHPMLTDLETANDGYAVLEGSQEYEMFQRGITTIEGHLEAPRHAGGMKRAATDITNALRKVNGMAESVVAAKEGYDHAAGAAEVLLKIDTVYRADKGLPAGK